MRINTFILHTKILLVSAVVVSSSVFWTHETVYTNAQLPDVEVGFPIGFISVDYLGEDNINSVIFKLPSDFGLYRARDDYYERTIIWWKFLADIFIVYIAIFASLKLLSKRWSMEQQISVLSWSVFMILVASILVFFL